MRTQQKLYREGIAAPSRICVFTLLLFCGQVLPLPLALRTLLTADLRDFPLCPIALAMGCIVRAASVVLFRQDWRSMLLHLVGVLVTSALQWNALVRKRSGRSATWKLRSYSAG